MFGMVVPVQNANAQLYRAANQYTDPTQGDNTENLDLVGAGSGQQDSFVNVIK
jgi:hypothetical protein